VWLCGQGGEGGSITFAARFDSVYTIAFLKTSRVT
jgi:hypothetical protein